MGLTTENWLRLESLFSQAIAMPASQREAFLRDRCAGDAALHERLRDMLAAEDRAGLLDDPAWPGASGASTTDEPAHTLVGRRIAGYRVLRVIAAGGMGTVYEAQQEHPSRLVALKVLSTALASPDALRRFEFEAETLARLGHPAIAAIYESGVFADDAAPHGRPFFAMELVDGQPLTHFADARRLDLQQRVALLRRVCEGVEHAHSRGVIHRDLKPANILVTVDSPAEGLGPVSREPAPKILDFGIARVIDAGDPQRRALTMRTTAGAVIGTLAYMSPEQIGSPGAGGRPPDGAAGHPIDVRSDVYALGVIAYELLGGRLPHDVSTASVPHAARLILESDPPSLGSLERRCRGDLETIVARALEKEPDRRYQSAAEFAEDLRRHLAHEPIAARRASRLYQLRKFARRNRAIVAGVLLAFAALTLGIIGTAWQWERAATQRDLALEAEARARANLRRAYESAMVLHELAEQQLSNIAGALEARLDQAQRALAQILELPLDDERTRRWGTSYAYQRVADVLGPLGRSAEALAMYRTALRLREEAVSAAPDDESMMRALAVGHWKVADALFRVGRFEDCLAHNHQAQALLERIGSLQAAAGNQVQAEHGYLSYGCRRLGDALAALGRREEALRQYQASVAHIDQWSRDEQPLADRQRRRGRINALRGWGELRLSMGESATALEKLHEALTLAEELGRDEGPMNVWERTNQSRLLASISEAQRALGDGDAALASARRAVEIAEPLAQADRDNIESQHALAHALLVQAGQQHRAALRDAASASLLRARELLEVVAARDREYHPAQHDLAAAQRLDAEIAAAP